MVLGFLGDWIASSDFGELAMTKGFLETGLLRRFAPRNDEWDFWRLNFFVSLRIIKKSLSALFLI